ncbi:MAG: hypothetical protein H6526_06580 [Actinobacteria bacterium]|nr:hypothetical protein [Actinomycetota bacterium]
MRISHETIYQALYVKAAGRWKRELILCLRAADATYSLRSESRRKTWAHITPVLIGESDQPGQEDRAVPQVWEGDLLIGSNARLSELSSNARLDSRCWFTFS